MLIYNITVRGSSTPTRRRDPQQGRASLRRDSLLDAAGELFTEVGFGGTTMTAIAERANASVGALYDYFPDKTTLANVLATRYTKEADEHWSVLLTPEGFSTTKQLAELFVDGILSFVEKRPSYPALLSAPIKYARSATARRPLRRIFAKAVRRVNASLTSEQAHFHAQVVVELLKALVASYALAAVADRDNLAENFKRLVSHYLTHT
ncbi:MAG TPA: TetR/AcrR family transcriptional regulator [Candidatus Deferrimicrobiaceae bacterium]|nr:TetR/AcrR family transcriptional regulator [Candidatus Deferrimicrobiaceae bacterium]